VVTLRPESFSVAWEDSLPEATCFQRTYTDSPAPFPLYLPEEIEQRAVDSDRPVFQDVLDWIQNFIVRPHPDMGRTGAVCPFVRQAMASRKIFFSRCHLQDPANAEEIRETVQVYANLFTKINRREDDAELLESLS
jgi:hypothetical protein